MCAEVKAADLLIFFHLTLFKQHPNINQSEFEKDTYEKDHILHICRSQPISEKSEMMGPSTISMRTLLYL